MAANYITTSLVPRQAPISLLVEDSFHWKMQLQTEISLSTLDAEFSALSARMRTLQKLCELLGEIFNTLADPTIWCQVLSHPISLMTTMVLYCFQPSISSQIKPWTSLLSSISSGTTFTTMAMSKCSRFLQLADQLPEIPPGSWLQSFQVHLNDCSSLPFLCCTEWRGLPLFLQRYLFISMSIILTAPLFIYSCPIEWG